MKVDVSWRIGRWERVTLALIGLILVMVCLVLLGGNREASRPPIVAEYRVDTAPRGFKPIRIAVISDTHIGGPIMSLDATGARALVEQVRELRPDLIILAGDYAGTVKGFDGAIQALSGLGAPLGVAAVLGNHDYDGGQDAKAMGATMRRNGFAPLINDHVDVGPVIVAGLDDLWKGESDIAEATRAFADARGRPVILVSHNPDVFPQVPKGVALTVAGHTHGAHAVFPLVGPIVSSSRYGQRYRRGLIVENGRSMVVTSGAGGFFFRWNVPPEVALITLGPRRD